LLKINLLNYNFVSVRVSTFYTATESDMKIIMKKEPAIGGEAGLCQLCQKSWKSLLLLSAAAAGPVVSMNPDSSQ